MGHLFAQKSNTSEKMQILRNLQRECKMSSDQLEFDILFKDCHSKHSTLEKKKDVLKLSVLTFK